MDYHGNTYCVLCEEWIRYTDKAKIAMGGYLCRGCTAAVPETMFPILERIHQRIDDAERRIEELEEKNK